MKDAIKQIEKARRSSIKAIGIKDSGGLLNYDEAIIGFELMRDKDYLNEDFIRQVAQFNALVVNGGKADNLPVGISKANYLEAIGEVMPLVGVSVIKGVHLMVRLL